MRTQGNTVIRSSPLALLFTVLFLSVGASAQAAGDSADLIVDEASGAVKIRQHDRWQSPAKGMVVSLPAVVSTGADGSVKLRQSETTISIAANTAIELLEGPVPGQPLQRVVQNKGSVFYDIETRESNKLRVEAPYLVAVIKGTQFNVTVTAETSTVALYEGRLSIEAPDVGDVVDLREGQIAKRHKDHPGITVLDMEDGEPLARGASPESESNSSAGHTEHVEVVSDGSIASGDRLPDLEFNEADLDVDLGDATVYTGLDADADLGDGDVDLGLDGSVDLGDIGLDVGLDAGADLDGVDIDLGLDGSADLGDTSLDVGLDASADLDDVDIDLGLDGSADLGDTGLDVGLDAAAELDNGEIDLGLDSNADLGDTSLDVGLDAGAELDDGEIDLGLDSSADLGDTGLDVGLDAGAEVGDGDIDVGLDGSVDLGDTSVDTGLDAGADLNQAAVDVGIGIDTDGGFEGLLDAELDLSLLDGSEDDTDTEEDAGLLPDLRDLLRR